MPGFFTERATLYNLDGTRNTLSERKKHVRQSSSCCRHIRFRLLSVNATKVSVCINSAGSTPTPPKNLTWQWTKNNLFEDVYHVPSGKLTQQWEIHHLKMYLLLKMVVFHCYVSLPEGISSHLQKVPGRESGDILENPGSCHLLGAKCSNLGYPSHQPIQGTNSPASKLCRRTCLEYTIR